MKQTSIHDFYRCKPDEGVNLIDMGLIDLGQHDEKQIAEISTENSETRRRRKMTTPRKFVFPKTPKDKPLPAHSDYHVLRMRERYKYKQVDFIEGRLKGLRPIIASGEDADEVRENLSIMNE